MMKYGSNSRTSNKIRVREDNTRLMKFLDVDPTPPASSRQLYPFTDLHRLTLACRQFQIETKLLPYTLNTFTLPLWAFHSMIHRSPEIMQNSVQTLRVHTGGYAGEKDEEAFLRHMEQMDVLNDLPLVKKVAVTTFHGVQLSERSLQQAKGMAKRFTGRDIEFVNF
jgi:hypothetical protein